MQRRLRFRSAVKEREGGLVVASFCEWNYSTNLAIEEAPWKWRRCNAKTNCALIARFLNPPAKMRVV